MSDHENNIEIGEDWIAGKDPDKTSYCSPWVLATVKHDAVANPQGKIRMAFTETVIQHSVAYLAGDVDITLP